MSASPLVETLVARAPRLSISDLSTPASAALEGLLQGLWEAGRSAWPAVALLAADLVTHIAGQLPEDVDAQGLPAYLAGLQAADLYLCCACACGSAGAIEAFDGAVLGRVPAFLATLRPTPTFVDEVRQTLRERLLVARDGEAPRIADYAGRGSLSSFVRVAALRAALNIRRRRDEGHAHEAEEVLERLAPAGPHPDHGYVTARYQTEFLGALRDAFAVLSGEQRSLMHLHYVGGLPTTKLAAILKLNQSTVVRRIAAAREAIFEQTRHLLEEKLRLSPSEFASLARELHGEIDLSLGPLLRNSGADGGK